MKTTVEHVPRAKEVVVIEDSGTDAKLILQTLRRRGSHVNVTLLTNGERASEHLDECESPLGLPTHQPDLILLDLELPRKDGLEILGELRSMEYYRGVPVVVFTNSSDPHVQDRCYRSGANCVVNKPVATEEFVAVLKAVERYWLEVLPLRAPGAGSPEAS